MAEQSDPRFAQADLLVTTPAPSIEIPAQVFFFFSKSTKNEWIGSHKKID